jgi:hypothetical protein
MTGCKVFCPASMCPLIAKDGSPWTGQKNAECPEHDDLDTGGCPWFSMACGTGGIHNQVDQAARDGGVFIAGPNQPRRQGVGPVKTFDCPREHECSWEKHKKGPLCPPRYALSLGLDPRVTLF